MADAAPVFAPGGIMRDLVVYAAGGGMRGIFGAGALHALAESGVRDRVQAFYGTSAGALNITHFALGSTTRAMEWYLHDVPQHGILARATTVALLRGEDVVDLPEAERVLDTQRAIDAQALSRFSRPVSFGVVGEALLEFTWLDARRPDAVRLLLASSTIFPFVREGFVIDGVRCIDGGYREGVCYTRLRREHPGAKLLLVLNDNEQESIVRRVAVGAMLRLRNERLAAVWLDTMDRAPAELAEATADPLAFVLRPDDRFPVHFATTEESLLAHGFWLGYQSVLKRRDRLLTFLEA